MSRRLDRFLSSGAGRVHPHDGRDEEKERSLRKNELTPHRHDGTTRLVRLVGSAFAAMSAAAMRRHRGPRETRYLASGRYAPCEWPPPAKAHAAGVQTDSAWRMAGRFRGWVCVSYVPSR